MLVAKWSVVCGFVLVALPVSLQSEDHPAETMENRERTKGEPQQRGADPIKQAELMLAEGVGMSEWVGNRNACNGTRIHSLFAAGYTQQVDSWCLM